ncbi:hypothetical protein AAHE18_03G324300 [Arachis hypogaea]
MALQFCFAGYHIVSRLALNIGVGKVVYPIYRNIIALLLLSPLACFLEKNERPPLTFSLLFQFFLLALLGITANQGFYLLGLYYASPTFASAMQNSVPAITFVMASALGLEEVNIARIDGLAKILGTIANVGGPPLLHLQTPQMQEESYIHQSSTKVQNWTWGCVYLLGHCLSWAAWMVFQALVVKKYPAKLSHFLYILLWIRNCIVWGVISLQTWCIQRGGPVCVAVFQPLQTFLVAIMAALILGDQLCSGGIISAILIMVGLYLVLWGKSKSKEKNATNAKKSLLTEALLNDEEENKHADAAPKGIP